MQPAFHRQRIAGFGEVITGQTLKMLDRWGHAARSGQALEVSQEFTDLTMKIITEAMFSTRLEAETKPVSKAIALLLEDMNFRFQAPFYPRFSFPTPRNRRALAALRVVDQTIYRIIHERRESGEIKNDLLGMLMEARDEDSGEAMTDQQLRDEVVTIFVAGHETTAVLLTWLTYLLSQHPEIEGRLALEESQALNGRLPTFNDLTGLPYLRMTIDETLRLFPPAWLTNRTCLAEDEICGYRIPAGEIVAISPYVIHRLPEYWPNPERFDPERFTPERPGGRPSGDEPPGSMKQHRFAYIPFGAGPHQCIGNNFALVEAQLIYTTLLQRYRLQATQERPVKPAPQVTLRPKDGLWMRLSTTRASKVHSR